MENELDQAKFDMIKKSFTDRTTVVESNKPRRIYETERKV